MKILLVILAILVGFSVWSYVRQAQSNARVNDWTARCIRDGGAVSVTRYGFTSNNLECFKNGKIIDHEN